MAAEPRQASGCETQLDVAVIVVATRPDMSCSPPPAQDFTFDTSGENTAVVAKEPDHRNQPPVDQGATGASQGLLDRKEVLGGESSPRWGQLSLDMG